jgi:hypothetical protein
MVGEAWSCCHRAHGSDTHFASGEGSEAVDGITRACVARRLSLEERQCPLGIVSGPHGQHSPVVLAQRHGTRPAFHAHAFAFTSSPRGAGGGWRGAFAPGILKPFGSPEGRTSSTCCIRGAAVDALRRFQLAQPPTHLPRAAGGGLCVEVP